MLHQCKPQVNLSLSYLESALFKPKSYSLSCAMPLHYPVWDWHKLQWVHIPRINILVWKGNRDLHMTLLKLILSVVFSTVLPWSTFSHSIHTEWESFLLLAYWRNQNMSHQALPWLYGKSPQIMVIIRLYLNELPFAPVRMEIGYTQTWWLSTM